jgi:hypothetical protein
VLDRKHEGNRSAFKILVGKLFERHFFVEIDV